MMGWCKGKINFTLKNESLKLYNLKNFINSSLLVVFFVQY